jgi:hypothetical protein
MTQVRLPRRHTTIADTLTRQTTTSHMCYKIPIDTNHATSRRTSTTTHERGRMYSPKGGKGECDAMNIQGGARPISACHPSSPFSLVIYAWYIPSDNISTTYPTLYIDTPYYRLNPINICVIYAGFTTHRVRNFVSGFIEGTARPYKFGRQSINKGASGSRKGQFRVPQALGSLRNYRIWSKLHIGARKWFASTLQVGRW